MWILLRALDNAGLKTLSRLAEMQCVILARDHRFSDIDAMDGATFELAVVELLSLLGFRDVNHIGGFDKGADITYVDEGERVGVQVKRRSSSVGIDAVRQLIDGMRRYECQRGLVVTNSYFTDQAIECADEWGIELWDRRKLADFVEGDAPEVDTSTCADCGKHVTVGVTKWCLDHPSRYGGRVLCPRHQRKR